MRLRHHMLDDEATRNQTKTMTAAFWLINPNIEKMSFDTSQSKWSIQFWLTTWKNVVKYLSQLVGDMRKSESHLPWSADSQYSTKTRELRHNGSTGRFRCRLSVPGQTFRPPRKMETTQLSWGRIPSGGTKISVARKVIPIINVRAHLAAHKLNLSMPRLENAESTKNIEENLRGCPPSKVACTLFTGRTKRMRNQ